MNLTINGAARAIMATDLAALLAELQIDPARVAIEHNGRILRADQYSATGLAEGDRLEIVRFVGGG
ncbi:sulfur carrier protein ThiS [Desulfuromonas thiophila]|uniref:Sulfur carrier protein n=1 Tax=Desulfuromonas thiophila TaxID=57664 RepID=A0A1G7BFV2_9BACT|nr:sulfur carrier protein ThiS [Desulfuromonas thiophila]MDD3801735.1 sulfur carrier protein ThiS [Desulfuromonas thiophila]SDE25640.1 sulfur carrier protein [Desulfuromonas thiophila]